MIIDTVNILTTHGLYFSSLENSLNLLPRKKILEEYQFVAKEFYFQEGAFNITLFGQYATFDDMAYVAYTINALVMAKWVHSITITTHGLTFEGVFLNGVQYETYLKDKVLVCRMRITVTGATNPYNPNSENE